MNHHWLRKLLRAAAVLTALTTAALSAHAGPTDIASVPMGTAPTSTVLPNLMFILDDSGSMDRNYTPDQANDTGTCKACSSLSCDMTAGACDRGHPPFYGAQFNTQYYNPAFTYKAGVDYAGASLGDQPAATARNNRFSTTDTSTSNLLTAYRDIWWCNTATASGSDFNDTNICRRNGIATNPFNYVTHGLPDTTYRFGYFRDVSHPVYYTITATEYCTDATLTVCTASTAPVTIGTVTYDKPAPVRWCRTTAATTDPAPVTGGAPVTCRATVDGTYRFPRYGNFTRFDILTGNTFHRAATRSDCSGAVGPGGCSYAEELQNFTNWFSYYRTRMLQMKTISGRVFAGLDERYRIGFLTINANSSAEYLKIGKFESSPTTHKQDWFNKFYSQLPGSGTPLREALSRVGRHYAGITTGINSFMPEDPVQFSCQPNYALLTTDGYWNGAGGQKIDGTAVGNQDNVPGPFVSRATGTLDGIGTVVTETTPTTTLIQQVCTGNNTTTFPGGGAANTPCGCSGVQTRVKQRTTVVTATQIFTDGVLTTPAPTTAHTFQDITTCTTPLEVTEVRNVVIQQQVICQGTGNATFPNNSGATTTTPCGCTGLNRRVKQRTINRTRTIVTRDGVVISDVTPTPGTTTFQDITACNALVSTTTTTVSHRQQVVCSEANATTFSTNIAPSFPGTTISGTATNVGCGCANGGPTNRSLRERLVTGTRVRTTTDGGSPTDNTTITSNAHSTVGATCITPGTPAITLSPNPTIVNPAGTPVLTGATITAADFTITPNPRTTETVASTTNNGGTTVAVTLSPNPSAPVPGTPTTNTALGGAANTLADVAMYYYKTDLRPSGTVSTDNVKGPNSTLLHQHMVTFTLGLGLDGQMLYDPNYDVAASGDFVKIKTGATTCGWTTGTCNWPVPVADSPSALDDLWHAAVNGRGRYFSAKDPASLESGLTATLNAINLVTGAAAASATSTPNLTPTDNFLFSSKYRTQKWDGEVLAEQLDPQTGVIQPTPVWTAATQLNARTSSNADSRTIYTFSAAAPDKLKPFLYANLTPSEQAYFNNKCSSTPSLSQCGPFTGTRLTDANSGANLVDWLRGQRGQELDTTLTNGVYRAREFLLGDTVNSKPVFMGPPRGAFADAVTPDYPSFKLAQANRQKVLFIAANDGMLHAFNADTGAELWAYVPKMIMPNLWKLANHNYDIGHVYYVDGSPTVEDMFIGGQWRSILVGGLNSGGRGYYALDVTDPTAPKGLWEICSDPALCAITDSDMGLSFGVPIITKRHDGTATALVTSGYNNATPGNGGGFLYVLNLATGAIIEKIGTTVSGVNVGNTTTPSGFAKISAFATNGAQNNIATIVYGGDLLGNIWRFNMTATPITVQRLGELKDGSTPPRPQSITTRPEITRFNEGFNVLYFGTGRFLGGTDLGDPALLSPPEPFAFQQSLYGVKDTGTDLGNLRLPAANLVQQTLTETSPTTRTITNNPINWTVGGNNGFYVDFNPGNNSPGERVNIEPTLIRGVLVVLTNEPNTQACSDGGNGFEYKLNYRSGSYVPGTTGGVAGGQISSSLLVGSVYFRTTTGALIGLNRTTTGGSILSTIPPGTAGGSGQRVSWRELVQ